MFVVKPMLPKRHVTVSVAKLSELEIARDGFMTCTPLVYQGVHSEPFEGRGAREARP